MNRRATNHVRSAGALVALLGPLGCGVVDGGTGTPDDARETPASTSEPLTAERNGTVIFSAENRTADYNRTFRGYAASVVYNGNAKCSAAMIGPNTMMTASHCGAGDATIDFFAHRANDKYATFRSDRFSCQRLLRMHDDTDLMLYYCPPRDGVNPGDKYGYLDFEVAITPAGGLDVVASRNRALVDTPVRTFWWNNLAQPVAVANAILVSEGKVTSREEVTTWPSIQVGCDSVLAPIMRTNVWVKQGVSGSSTLSSYNRIIGGPTTLASSAAQGAATLTTNAIIDYLTRTVVYSPTGGQRCDGGGGSQLNRALIESLGLVLENYAGRVDKNNDGLFDLHQDLEAGRLLMAADHYWLGFESNRRNKAWTKSTGASAPEFLIAANNENGGQLRMRHGSTATHRTLNLKSGEQYQLKGTLAILGGTGTVPIDSGTEPLGSPLVTLSTPGTQRFAVNLGGQGASHVLKFGPATQTSSTTPNMFFAGVTLARMNASYDFRTFDQRYHWFTETAKNGMFLPFGTDDSSSLIDFSLAVMPFVPVGSSAPYFGTSNQLCFDARTDVRAGDASAVPDPVTQVRVVDATGNRLVMVVHLTNAWTRACSETFTVAPATAKVWFDGTNVPYLVDNVLVNALN